MRHTLICSAGNATRLQTRLEGRTKCMGNGTLLSNQLEYWQAKGRIVHVQVKPEHILDVIDSGAFVSYGEWPSNAFAISFWLDSIAREQPSEVALVWGDLMLVDQFVEPALGLNIYNDYNADTHRYGMTATNEVVATEPGRGTIPGFFIIKGQQKISYFTNWLGAMVYHRHQDFCDLLVRGGHGLQVTRQTMPSYNDIGDEARFDKVYGAVA